MTTPTRGWHLAGESLAVAATVAYTRAVLLDALGRDANEAWAAWANVVAHALYLGSVAGTARAQIDVESAGARATHEDPSIGATIEVAAPLAAIKRLEDTAIRSGTQVDLLKSRMEAAVTEYAKIERAEGAAGLVQTIRSWMKKVEESFWVRGASPAQTSKIRDVIIESMSSMGRVDRQTAATYGDVISRVRGFMAMSDNRADTIVRTNMLRTFNLAQVDRLEQPDARRVIPLMILVEIHDSRTRGAPDGIYAGSRDRNPGYHWQMDGLVGTIEQFRSWNVIPPNGFRCRGAVRGLTLAECEEMGFLYPDGTLDFSAIRMHNGARLTIIGRGLYPDRGFKSTRQAA